MALSDGDIWWVVVSYCFTSTRLDSEEVLTFGMSSIWLADVVLGVRKRLSTCHWLALDLSGQEHGVVWCDLAYTGSSACI